MNTITLHNTFHGARVNVRVNADNQSDAWAEIQSAVHGQARPTAAAKARLRRVRNALCGNDDCRCGIVR